jgi:hypothetical protein
LYSRIYTNVENRLRDYYQAVEDWEYHKLSGEALEQTVHRDSLKMRQLFELLHVRPDTASQLKNSYCPDSVEPFLRWYLNRWLREAPSAPVPFRVIDPTLSLTPDSLITDSLRIDSLKTASLIADSLAKDSIKGLPESNIILNKKGEVVAIKGRRLAPVNTPDPRHLPADRKKPVRLNQ